MSYSWEGIFSGGVDCGLFGVAGCSRAWAGRMMEERRRGDSVDLDERERVAKARVCEADWIQVRYDCWAV